MIGTLILSLFLGATIGFAVACWLVAFARANDCNACQRDRRIWERQVE